ncbi:hypothetical protein [Cupriavidus taiwanensis]|nr:hypothetical protein [Cupriavidus taiwanensis]
MLIIAMPATTAKAPMIHSVGDFFGWVSSACAGSPLLIQIDVDMKMI